MSTDEIIQAWKAEDDDGDMNGEDVPENPAGELELSDENLAYIDGASCMFNTCGSCTGGSCNNPKELA
jgi:mersacidin/lichenicidin family type 2 lantibiotic